MTDANAEEPGWFDVGGRTYRNAMPGFRDELDRGLAENPYITAALVPVKYRTLLTKVAIAEDHPPQAWAWDGFFSDIKPRGEVGPVKTGFVKWGTV